MHIERFFGNKVSNQFHHLISSDDWLLKSTNQLKKDFIMSGNAFSFDQSLSLTETYDLIVHSIEQAQCNKPLWDNLLYRIDLPQGLDLESLDIEQLSELFLLRAFQKVWLRKQFAS